jgi:hypothetical protein
MKYKYKDFEVVCTKENSLAGYPTIYYAIYDRDGVEVVANFTEDFTSLKKYATGLKEVIDDIIDNPEDYYDEYDMYDDVLSCGCCACCGCSCDDDWEDFDDY